jgi:glycosyltransferase involved in cell wall biosynthesis
MNIFQLTETGGACDKWRAAIPAKYLRRRGHNVQVLSTTMPDYVAPDVLVVYRGHFTDTYKLVDWCKKKSIRVVFDTDDALNLIPQSNVHYRELQSRAALFEFLLEEADSVTTTTETLAAHLRKWNPNVVVIPNSIDPEDWRIAPRQAGTRVGWTGGETHIEDLAVALDAVREVQKKHLFDFVIQGICVDASPDALYQRCLAEKGKDFAHSPLGKSLKRFLAKLSGIRYEFRPFVPVAAHPEMVSALSLDLGIAPLVDDEFNRHKSCIKYYEYAMTGAVTVASHVLPYSAEVPTTAKNNRDSWRQKLEETLDSDRESLWREQKDWVMTHRNIEKNVALWEQVFAGKDQCAAVQAGQKLAHAGPVQSTARM